VKSEINTRECEEKKGRQSQHTRPWKKGAQLAEKQGRVPYRNGHPPFLEDFANFNRQQITLLFVLVKWQKCFNN
jgi:hypothetical protein